MKCIIIAMLSLMATGLLAQTPETKLDQAFERFATAATVPEMLAASGEIDLIALQNPDLWPAQYSAAVAKAIISYRELDAQTKDQLLDLAVEFRDKAKAIAVDSCEQHVLSALIANARIAVDGKHRWQQYGKVFDAHLQAAMELNPENPRIYYLKGVSLFHTPKMFGGGKKNASEYFEKAAVLFEKEKEKSGNGPHWGEDMNRDYLEQCQKK